jgi:hypothetical protein
VALAPPQICGFFWKLTLKVNVYYDEALSVVADLAALVKASAAGSSSLRTQMPSQRDCLEAVRVLFW